MRREIEDHDHDNKNFCSNAIDAHRPLRRVNSNIVFLQVYTGTGFFISSPVFTFLTSMTSSPSIAIHQPATSSHENSENCFYLLFPAYFHQYFHLITSHAKMAPMLRCRETSVELIVSYRDSFNMLMVAAVTV